MTGLGKRALRNGFYNDFVSKLFKKYQPRNHWHTEASLRSPILAVHRSIYEEINRLRSKTL